MSEHITINVTGADLLHQFETIRLRSAKGDYLHRPDGPPGVTTWPAGELDWRVERGAGGRIRLKSWKGDYLHRPDGPPGVTTWPVGEIDWTVEAVGGSVRLKSWKGDYLCRVDAPAGVTTANSGALDWSVETRPTVTGSATWQRWLDQIVSDEAIAVAGIYWRQSGACCAASPGLTISVAEARALEAGMRDRSLLQAAGAMIAGQKYMFLTVLEDGVIPATVLRRGPVSALVVNSLQTTIVALTVPSANVNNAMRHRFVATSLMKDGY